MNGRRFASIRRMVPFLLAIVLPAMPGCVSARPPPAPVPAGAPPSAPPVTATPMPVPSSVRLELVAQGFVSPVGFVPPPDGTGRLFIMDQAGTIWVMMADGTLLREPFLDLRERMARLSPSFDERGLLGLAFHPAFKQNGRFFVYYSAPLRPAGPAGWNHTSHISEFRVFASNPNRADPASERIVLQVDEPQFNHNGGQIVFGPDGYLYIPLGDGGAANDRAAGHSPIGNGQDTSTLLGKILRIDVDGAAPYAIPPDNPFVGEDGRDEIFATGFRNPFRISFDAGGSRELVAGDVGQGLWEEVDIVVKGGNYGWNIKEGKHCFDPENAGVSPPQCPDVDASGRPLIDPVIEYRNAAGGGIGTAVIGGFVYRGGAIPALQGAYIFGDHSSSTARPDGKLFIAIRPSTPGGAWQMKELRIATSPDGRLNAFLRSFGQDSKGELYVLTADVPGPTGTSGKIYQIVP